MCGQCVVLLIDEIQYLSEKELSSLIMAMHTMQQRQLPLILIGAGLPILTRLAGESKSYAERLFNFPEIGKLEPSDAAKALNLKINSIGPTRANLIRKGMIYSPNYGEMAFSVPLCDEFMKRIMGTKS